jgi:hypothetical protein
MMLVHAVAALTRLARLLAASFAEALRMQRSLHRRFQIEE